MGFRATADEKYPVLVAGGYGMAALYLVAKNAPVKGTAFFGGRSAPDILCVDEFTALGWDVLISTEDGSLGVKGLVTDALESWLQSGFEEPRAGIFRVRAERHAEGGRRSRDPGNWTAWLSMDNKMGCGVGACLTCVQKIRTPDGGWTWERVCREGPVFECRNIVWNDEI